MFFCSIKKKFRPPIKPEGILIADLETQKLLALMPYYNSYDTWIPGSGGFSKRPGRRSDFDVDDALEFPYQYPYGMPGQYRDVSPPRNRSEYPRPGYYRSDYRSVSPPGLGEFDGPWGRRGRLGCGFEDEFAASAAGGLRRRGRVRRGGRPSSFGW